MSKVTLEYKLPGEKTEMLAAIKGMDWIWAVWDLDQWLRGSIKYGDKEEFQEVRDELHDIMHSYGVSFEDLE